ncbi:phage tail protein [Cloacibacillus sp. An23]|uniref:phage tail protein n=1 Tax=Cloacibacillus sp. An23 TaxID=1965591 RepID=UPI000B3AF01F|nr:phage tail protein [Cloacibacillus sp. An23]OUO94819.1 hypothetical protein B5F39_02825 [Cloacibacillus sp. An23]
MIGVRSGINEYGQPSKFILSGYVGEFKYFGFESVPPHCLACDGSEVSRETYSELFAVFGTMYGAGNGTTTFNLPDFRGAFLRCVGGNAANLGVLQDATLVGQYCLGNNGSQIALAVYQRDSEGTLPRANTSYSYTPMGYIPQSEIVSGNIGWTSRPLNYAVNICVVYE